ncbi:ABC transporter permease subunit [Pararhizobium sp.]|uniref:ABC transporter permease subunit n=1 Tax=Pararhizobium sp. TaxID=1977563 RepID=UPI002721CBC4|nr:ABC transporter permease subunit [Pararhizobium sp.]MDO9415548.1 ABC transporter permease subunit [Pararhizobium sp.]
MTDIVGSEMVSASRVPKASGLQWLLPQMSIYLWLLLLVILPNALLIFVSFLKSSGGLVIYEFNTSNLERIIHSKSVWILLARTLTASAASVLLATLIAYPMAYYAARVLRRGKIMAVLLVAIPLWISLLMRIFAWRLILGERGILNSVLLWTGIITEPSDALLYNQFAVFLTFAYVAIPFIFISVYTAVERIPGNLVEAANDCGAGKWRAFSTVIWPLSRPGLAIGVSLAFLMVVGDYVTPSMVGGLDGTMLGMVIASQFGLAGNWPYGAALGLLLLLSAALLLVVLNVACRVPGILVSEGNEAPALSTSTRRSPMARAKSWVGFALFCLPYVFLYAPLAVITLFSFSQDSVPVFPPSGFTLRWYIELADNQAMIQSLVRSLVVAGITLAISIVVGTFFAVLLAIGRIRGATVVGSLLLAPVAIPGVIFGITMVLTFQLLGITNPTVRVVLGHCTFVMPVIMMVVLNRMRRLDPALAEASADLGAHPFKTFYFVLLPLIRGAIIGGALLGFTLSVDEVIVSIFLTGSEPTLPVWVWNQVRFGFTPSVNAIFVCIGVGTVLLIVLSRRFIGER